MEFAKLEPFGEERADLRNGILASSLINNLAMIWTGENPDTEPKDFMPSFDMKEPNPVDVAAKIDMFFSAMAAATNPLQPAPSEMPGENR